MDLRFQYVEVKGEQPSTLSGGLGFEGEPVFHFTKYLPPRVSCYQLRWDTQCTDAEALPQIAEFYRAVHAQPRIRIPKKNFEGLSIGNKDHETIAPLERITDTLYCLEEIQKKKATLLRVESRYFHLGYATQNGGAVVPDVLDALLVASCSNLTEEIMSIMIPTHRRFQNQRNEVFPTVKLQLNKILKEYSQTNP